MPGSLYVSNLTDVTCIAMEPTNVQSYVIAEPLNVEQSEIITLLLKPKALQECQIIISNG